jgi:hypothetical protein
MVTEGKTINIQLWILRQKLMKHISRHMKLYSRTA